MGRGRQKAKHTKVARELKYFSPETNYGALERELSAGQHSDENSYVDRWADQWTGGFARLRTEGLVYLDGRQDHAITATAPGHSTMLSGRVPASTGIASNALGIRTIDRPLVWGTAFSHANNEKSGPGDTTIGSWAGSSDSAFASSINAGYASARARDVIATAMTYQIGDTTLGANYSHTEYSPGTFSRFSRTASSCDVAIVPSVPRSTASLMVSSP